MTMSLLDLDLYRSEEISLRCIEHSDQTVDLVFAGSIEHPDPGVYLDPLLADLHTRLLARRVLTLRVDFTELAFLNSGGIKSLIKWVMCVSDLAPENRYAVQLAYTSEITWQYASLKAITLLSRGALSVIDRAAAESGRYGV